MQTTGDDALLTCRSAGPHEIYWMGPNGQPVDIKSKKYQVCQFPPCPCICLHIHMYYSFTNSVTSTFNPMYYIFQMTEQGDLIVRNLSFEDMGNFQCLVKNLSGSDMIETFVYPLAQS